MYQLADKNKVMSLFHKGESVSQIRLKSNVSKSTLYRWKAEYDTTGEIMGYIRKGQLDKAKQTILQFQGENRKTSELLTNKAISQFIRFGYLDDAKELAEDLLKKYPNNLSARSQLVTIAIQKGDWERAEGLCREVLVIDSRDLSARSQLVTIAKQKGDWRETERLCREMIALWPNDLQARSQLVTIAKQRGDLEEVSRLSREILLLDPNNLRSRSQLVTIAKQKGDWKEVSRLCREILLVDPSDKIAKKQLKASKRMQRWQRKREERKGTSQAVQEKPKSNSQSSQHNIPMIRNQIQAGTFLLDDIEARQREMQEMGINEVQINILLAEAYERQNLPKQTKTYLKKALQGAQDPKLQKAIKALLETAQTKKKKLGHINPWDSITTIKCENNVRQTTKTQKEPDEK